MGWTLTRLPWELKTADMANHVWRDDWPIPQVTTNFFVCVDWSNRGSGVLACAVNDFTSKFDSMHASGAWFSTNIEPIQSQFRVMHVVGIGAERNHMRLMWVRIASSINILRPPSCARVFFYGQQTNVLEFIANGTGEGSPFHHKFNIASLRCILCHLYVGWDHLYPVWKLQSHTSDDEVSGL